MDMTTPESPRPLYRRRRVITIASAVAGVLLIVAVVLAVVLPSKSAPKAATAAHLRGTVQLETGQYLRDTDLDRSPCTGLDNMADVKGDAPVTVTDSGGKVIAMGKLRPGYMTGGYMQPTSTCVFEFDMSVPASAFYGVQVAGQQVKRYTAEDVREPLVLMFDGS